MTKSRNDVPENNSTLSLDGSLSGGLAKARAKSTGLELSIEDLPPDAAEMAAKPGRVLCGDIDMRIGADGVWYYLGSPIGRKELVKLFSDVIRCDDAGDYWLVTPAEMARIKVDDAPFTAVEMICEGEGENRVISFRTNADTVVTLDAEHPFRVATDMETGEPRPYITIRDRLEALIVRSVFYQLIEEGKALMVDGEEVWGVWSGGCFFPIGTVGQAE